MLTQACTTLLHGIWIGLQVFSDQEGFQIFTGPLEGDLYLRGIAIEASGPVDAPNNPSFTSISLREGEERSQTTVYKFL